ncbi:MAG TPA: metal-sulfur cluster assembly factor [Patescibacteria group bacterium]|nr:metal-sulfur cluster assembly factor [Patescibacteria group bacterium]
MKEEVVKSKILKALTKVIDPELNVNIVDLGFIYDVKVTGSKADILMTLTSPYCPLALTFKDSVKKEVKKVKGIQKVIVKLTFDPPWNSTLIKPHIKLKLGF